MRYAVAKCRLHCGKVALFSIAWRAAGMSQGAGSVQTSATLICEIAAKNGNTCARFISAFLISLPHEAAQWAAKLVFAISRPIVAMVSMVDGSFEGSE